MHRVVPELIVENYRAGRYRGEFDAVGMFLDLSGFSVMTDVLMQHGQHGAEVLAGLMHSVFDPLVESVFDYGGKIIGFAGDGILALYPVDGDAHLTALRALTSAHLIQKRLTENPSRQTIYERFSISAKIGLAGGSVSWGILRSPREDQATYYFRGSAVDQSAEAEHHARAGDILLTKSLGELLEGLIETSPCGPFRCFEEFRVDLPAPRPIVFPPVDLAVSRLFMPEEVIAYDVRGEFRQIVNLFMRFPNLTETQLSELMDQVFDLKTKYGGLLNRLDFGDKGCNLLLLWGAPVAYENDISRALNFLLELKAHVRFPITSGVTYYIAHAGYLGSPLCEDYTCYGWGVNLASRFMMTAPIGDTWVDDRIARRISKRFDVEFIGSQIFKGFAVEQKVHRLHGYKQSQEPIYQGEMVGREDKLAQLASFIAPLWQDRFAGALLISGDAGVGKSRLLYEFRLSKIFADKDILWAVCLSDQVVRQSFNPLRSWLSRYFGVFPNQPVDERRRAFDSKLNDLLATIPARDLAREMDRTRSILGAVLDLHWEGSLYEQLDAEVRYNNTFLTLINLIKAESLRQPVVFVLEDFQFTDHDTRDFVARLKRALLAAGESYPVAIIVTSRPPTSDIPEQFVDVLIDLRGLSSEAIGHLAEIRLGAPPAPHLVTLLVNRSEGNPYFAEEIIRYLQEESLIETGGAGWRLVRPADAALLPGDIRSILVARLDQLPRGVRESVQTASILGREFEIPLLTHMWREDERLLQYVEEAEQAAVWRPVDEVHYIFAHRLLRDAAYEMQMQARRRELHALAVDALEHLYGDSPARYAELAHHADYAGLGSRAQKYYRLAGKTAAASYQNQQAVEYFTLALAFTDSDDLTSQFDILVQRVELYSRLGKRDLQWKDLLSLERWAEDLDDSERVAKSWMLRASYYFATGDSLHSVECAERAAAYPRAPANEELRLYTQTVWSLALLRLGRLEEAMQMARATLEQAQATGNRREAARILSAMGLIALEQKEPAHSHGYLTEALRIARELKDLGLQSRALNNLAVAEHSVNRNYALAHEYYEQTYQLARELGDRNVEGFSLSNLGFIAGIQGQFLTARSYHEQALLAAREIGNQYFETYTLINLSAVAGNQSEPQAALQYAREAASLARKISERSGEAWAALYKGYAYLALGQLEEAKDAFHQAAAIRDELDQPALLMEPLAGLVETYLSADDLESAWREGEKVLRFLESGSTLDGTEEPLRVYYTCYRLLQEKQHPSAQQILETANRLLEDQVSKLRDEAARTSFIENFPWRRALYRAARD